MSDDINTEKIRYLINLLGRRRSEKDLNLDSEDDFEDIEESPFKQMSKMLEVPLVVQDTYVSETTDKQHEVEKIISNIYSNLVNETRVKNVPFDREKHTSFANNSLINPMPGAYVGYDANHGWMLYWLLNFMQMMDQSIDQYAQMTSDKINGSIVDNGLGGIGGGAKQLGHAASAYSSILALVLIEDHKTLEVIRKPLYQWLLSLKNTNGSFCMYKNGESDTRSTYCVLVVASLLGILTDELVENVPQWIASCQTYEGGFAGIPNTEAHGGYTYCAISALILCLSDKNNIKDRFSEFIDIDALLRWMSMRQHHLEGGFSGRTNKLVDACYSFWIGSSSAILEAILGVESLFDRQSLKTYILNCCQDSNKGGLKDKPGKSTDFYHSNYTTMGLSIAESSFSLSQIDNFKRPDDAAYCLNCEIYSLENLRGLNPVFGLPSEVAEKCRARYLNL